MTVIQNLISELREKRLWPVAVALIVALIAVPLLLSSSNNPTPVAAVPGVASGGAAVPAVPAVSVTTTPSNARLTGHERNPFAQQGKKSSGSASSKTGKAARSANSKTSSDSAKGSSVSGAVGGGAKTVAAPTTSSTTTTATTPSQPTTTDLAATEAYHVTISLTNSSGGVDTINPVERLSVLPNRQLPLLVELGVQKGGHRVIFVVQPGTVVDGPGTCTPGPIDCEILSLAPNQIEGVATSSSSGKVTGTMLSVTGINAEEYSSSAAADQARLDESAAGRRLLNASTASALSLFQYKPSLGAVVDLSNVTVGGN
jgi:hypothetical protein